MKKLALLLCLVILMTGLTACGDDNDNEPTASTQVTTAEGNIITTLTVRGMVCGRCEREITNALSPLEQVISVTADFAADTVVIEHGGEFDFAAVKDIIELDLGFDLERVENMEGTA